MEVICVRNVFEISHFLTVIEFNTTFAEKRVGRNPQEILTRPTYRKYLLAFRAQYEGKMELSHDMVSFFLLSARLPTIALIHNSQ
jgi:hypothetical protein